MQQLVEDKRTTLYLNRILPQYFKICNVIVSPCIKRLPLSNSHCYTELFLTSPRGAVCVQISWHGHEEDFNLPATSCQSCVTFDWAHAWTDQVTVQVIIATSGRVDVDECLCLHVRCLTLIGWSCGHNQIHEMNIWNLSRSTQVPPLG